MHRGDHPHHATAGRGSPRRRTAPRCPDAPGAGRSTLRASVVRCALLVCTLRWGTDREPGLRARRLCPAPGHERRARAACSPFVPCAARRGGASPCAPSAGPGATSPVHRGAHSGPAGAPVISAGPGATSPVHRGAHSGPAGALVISAEESRPSARERVSRPAGPRPGRGAAHPTAERSSDQGGGRSAGSDGQHLPAAQHPGGPADGAGGEREVGETLGQRPQPHLPLHPR